MRAFLVLALSMVLPMQIAYGQADPALEGTPVEESAKTPSSDTSTSEDTLSKPDAGPLLLSINEIHDALKTTSENDNFEPITAAFSIPELQKKVFSEHYTSIFAYDDVANDFATYFATEQGAFEAVSRDELAIIARNLGIGWAHETAALGMARLPVENQRLSLEISLATLENMDEHLCAGYTRGALDAVEVARGEIAYLVTLPAEDLEPYLGIFRAAIVAEIADDPAFVPLPNSDQAKAGAAYQDAFVKAIEAHPENELVLEAVNNFDLASDYAVCELTKLSLQSALSVEGETGDMIVKLLTSG